MVGVGMAQIIETLSKHYKQIQSKNATMSVVQEVLALHLHTVQAGYRVCSIAVGLIRMEPANRVTNATYCLQVDCHFFYCRIHFTF